MITGISAIAMGVNTAFERPKSGPNLTAHQDTAGNWQIGDGITILPDGTKVRKGMSLKPAEYDLISEQTMKRYEDNVRRVAGDKLNQYQFDACVLMDYNTGAFATSEGILGNINAGRYADAAAAFGDWVYATKRTTFNADGSVKDAAFGPDGKMLTKGQEWKVAYRGLYRRNLHLGCLFLGLDGFEACDESRIELRPTPIWQPDWNGVGRWRDRVDYKTPWEDVLRIARQHPLPPHEIAAQLPADVIPAPIKTETPPLLLEAPKPMSKVIMIIGGNEVPTPDGYEQAPESAQTAWLNAAMLAVMKKEPVPEFPLPAKTAPRSVASKPPKAIEDISYLPKGVTPKVERIQDAQRGKGYAKSEQAKMLGGVAAAGWAAEQLGAVEPIIKATKAYTGQTVAIFFLGVILISVVLFYYGKWQRRKGEAEADTLLG